MASPGGLGGACGQGQAPSPIQADPWLVELTPTYRIRGGHYRHVFAWAGTEMRNSDDHALFLLKLSLP